MEAAGVDPTELVTLRWDPDRRRDTLRALLARLTVTDANGRVRQWGYNAANDLQGIYLNYIGSAGGVFTVTSPETSSWPAGWRCSSPAPTTWRRSPIKRGSGGVW